MSDFDLGALRKLEEMRQATAARRATQETQTATEAVEEAEAASSEDTATAVQEQPPAQPAPPRALAPGDVMPDGTVYAGTYSYTWNDVIDEAGDPLTKTFNLFAAPRNLNGTMTYKENANRISKITNLCGYRGSAYGNREELFTRLKAGKYAGEWIVPTPGMSEVLYAARNEGALAGTLPASDHWYLPLKNRDRDDAYFFSMSSGTSRRGSYEAKSKTALCRTVRLVETGAAPKKKRVLGLFPR